MRSTLTTCLSLVLVIQSFAAPAPVAPAIARTIGNLPNFPLSHLKMSLSPRLYKSLMISPVTAWVVAQVPGRGADPKIVRTDADGVFDKLALEMAKGWGSIGYDTLESRTHSPSVMVHLVIYKIADAIMAVNFGYNDEAIYAGIQHSDVWVGVYKNGKWTRVGGTKVVRNFPEPYR